jgi:hypothetical protein
MSKPSAEDTIMRIAPILLGTALAFQAIAQDRTVETKKQTVNSAPQTVHETERSLKKEQEQHWNDGLNTKRAPDPRKRDEYGAPKVSPPKGQGTDNDAGLPKKDPPSR